MNALRLFWEKHPRAEAPLLNFVDAVKAVNWKSFSELRATFPSADRYNDYFIFNIGGNHFRLIAWIHYSRTIRNGRQSIGRIYVRHVLTHAEYDTGDWKVECN